MFKRHRHVYREEAGGGTTGAPAAGANPPAASPAEAPAPGPAPAGAPAPSAPSPAPAPSNLLSELGNAPAAPPPGDGPSNLSASVPEQYHVKAADGTLDGAGRMLGLGNKTLGGKAIMKRFANRAEPLPGARAVIDAAPDRAKAVAEAIAAWELYLDYSVQDTDLLRAVWKTTRPLDGGEWAEYWVSERINDRGMMADLDVCRGAAAYREEEAAHVVEQIKAITDGAIAGPTFTAQINKWLYERLPDDLAELMVKDRDDEGYATRLTGDKNVMTRLLEEIESSDTPPDDKVVDLLEVLEFGRSSSAVKFQKIVDQEVDGRLSGSYVFNGAGQTGRFCVAPDTLINTPQGVRKIVDLAVGDFVTTHLRRSRRVTAKIYKGIEQMFRLEGPCGEYVVATAAHRVLTNKGWLRIDECFECAVGGSWVLRRG